MSEHTETRLPLINKLLELGWDKNQIQFEPEWRIPQTPSEASRREKGHRFKSFPVDIAIFDHPSYVGEYEHLQIIIETKAPNITEGINQLEIYMSLEPHVLLGIWTNGSDIRLIYRTPDGKFEVDKNGRLPKPTDSLIRASKKKLTWNDLENPSTSDLKRTFSKLLNVVVGRDALSTRRDDQLNNLCNVILAKLEGDKIAKYSPDHPAPFQVWDTEEETAKRVKELFSSMRIAHSDLFLTDSDVDINFDDHTIHTCAYEISKYKLRDTPISVISEAFQIFRTSSLKSEEGQYYTPYPVIRSAIKLMDIKPSDKVLDPACGTGGFLLESFRQLAENHPTMSSSDTTSWANRHLFGVDKDRINVKLTKAIMLTIGDGSTNTYLGDSIRSHLWNKYFKDLELVLSPSTFTCIVTNPPFGKGLKVSKVDSKAAKFTISRKPKKSSLGGFNFSDSKYEEREIGILFLERCYDLLREGGRLGIVLPETYMFSPSYAWLRHWLKGKLELKGMLNIPMEAFQGFCRAKTNFYIFEKLGRLDNLLHKPNWFKESETLIVNARTCGINKDGHEQYIVNPKTGVRSNSEIDDDLAECCDSIKVSDFGRKEIFYCKTHKVVESDAYVPKYFDHETFAGIKSLVNSNKDLNLKSLGELKREKEILLFNGHGSPSSDQRLGDIPYIKVSDLRAGHVNINPTNMIPVTLAKKFWRQETSGLRAYDLISPERASKNIGEFCVLMPGQENAVLTKEVIVVRTNTSLFDQFYLLWALTLKEVVIQWERIVFMQTNREDVGKRIFEIQIPVPASREVADQLSSDFRSYYTNLEIVRRNFIESINSSGFKHYIHLGS